MVYSRCVISDGTRHSNVRSRIENQAPFFHNVRRVSTSWVDRQAVSRNECFSCGINNHDFSVLLLQLNDSLVKLLCPAFLALSHISPPPPTLTDLSALVSCFLWGSYLPLILQPVDPLISHPSPLNIQPVIMCHHLTTGTVKYLFCGHVTNLAHQFNPCLIATCLNSPNHPPQCPQGARPQTCAHCTMQAACHVHHSCRAIVTEGELYGQVVAGLCHGCGVR